MGPETGVGAVGAVGAVIAVTCRGRSFPLRTRQPRPGYARPIYPATASNSHHQLLAPSTNSYEHIACLPLRESGFLDSTHAFQEAPLAAALVLPVSIILQLSANKSVRRIKSTPRRICPQRLTPYNHSTLRKYLCIWTLGIL